MADIVADGFTRVAWVTTIANIALPTTTELNLGTLLHDTMTADGFNGFQPDTARIDVSKFSATFNSNQPGRVSFSGQMLQFCKQNPTDPIYSLLFPKLVAGNLVVRRSIAAATGWVSGQALEVYPSVTGQGKRVDPEPNSLERWIADIMFSAQPNLLAAVA